MSKGTRWIKRVTALLLVLLLCIESFAAVVSDNDGSAFITKAEFDSLKNDFQAQIDNYNTSIDSKIDGAIAAYLAGITVQKENDEKLLLMDSKLEYPLQIYMKNTEFDVTNYDNWVYNSCWKPDYDFTYTFQRAAKFGTASLYMDNLTKTNKLKWLYKGERSGDDYIVSGIVENYKVIVRGMFNLMNTSKTSFENLSAAVFLDQTKDTGAETWAGDANIWYRSNIRADYNLNFLVSTGMPNNVPPSEFLDDWQNTSGPSLSTYNNKLYAKVTGTKALWCGLTNSKNNAVSADVVYNESNIKKVFNYADATSTAKTGTVVAPVTWDYEVYVTNKDKQKQDCKEVASCSLYEDNVSLSKTFYVRHTVDPGWCLEPENYGQTSRAWYKKSLINPKRLKYKFTTPYTESEFNHKMIEGIPLTELEKKKNVEDTYKYLHVKFNLTRDSGMTAKPSIFFFTEPTVKYKLSDIKGDSFFDISKSNKLTDKKKYIELADGENNIYVDTSALGKTDKQIYYKIVWESDMNKSVSITKPVATLRKVS